MVLLHNLHPMCEKINHEFDNRTAVMRSLGMCGAGVAPGVRVPCRALQVGGGMCQTNSTCKDSTVGQMSGNSFMRGITSGSTKVRLKERLGAPTHPVAAGRRAVGTRRPQAPRPCQAGHRAAQRAGRTQVPPRGKAQQDMPTQQGVEREQGEPSCRHCRQRGNRGLRRTFCSNLMHG